MKRLFACFLLAPAAVMSLGCAARQVPLTAELRTEHRLGDEDVRRLQLYVSDDVKLRREVETRGRAIHDGSLRLLAGKNIDEVTIGRRTPCVATAVSADSITVSFDEGSTLTFSLQGREPVRLSEPLHVEPRFAEPPGGRPKPFELVDASSGLEGNYWLVGSNGAVEFRGLRWDAVGESIHAHLMVDAEQLDEVEESHTTLHGRRLGSN